MVATKIVTREIAPGVTAQIFWLKNRNLQRCRDKQEIAHSVKVEDVLRGLPELPRSEVEAGLALTLSEDGSGNGQT